MNISDLELALTNPNVQAFMRMIRVGEGTVDEDGYRRMFGGELFHSFADHPRKAITKPLGRSVITSTAAGAYQFLSRTWDGLAKQWGLPDFSPHSQDLGCVALIIGRKALNDVIAGHFESAVRKCNREWASLPESPYGQPVKTMVQAREAYVRYGGSFADQPTLTDTTPAVTPLRKEEIMPLPAIAMAVLPAIIEAVPKLGKLFGSGSEVAERNVKAAEIALSVVKDAVGAKNEQEAMEIVKSDPAAAATAQRAIEERWFELTESGGGGIDGARKMNADLMRSDAPTLYKNPAIWISAALLIFPLMLMTDVLFVHPEHYTGELRVQIVTAVLAVIAMVGGYWLGTSFSSARKTEISGK